MPCHVCGSFALNEGKCTQCGFEDNDILFLNQEQASYWMENHVAKLLEEKQMEEEKKRRRDIAESEERFKKLSKEMVTIRRLLEEQTKKHREEKENRSRDNTKYEERFKKLNEEIVAIRSLLREQANMQRVNEENRRREVDVQERRKKLEDLAREAYSRGEVEVINLSKLRGTSKK